MSSPSDPAVAAWLAAPEPAAEEADPEMTAAILDGLQRQPDARISQLFLYDSLGSRLYEEICKTAEYYLTNAEAELLREHAAEIAADPRGLADPAAHHVVIELGAGEGHKTLLLLRELIQLQARAPIAHRTVYAPIDVSASSLESNLESAAPLRPALETRPLVGVFEEQLPIAAALGGTRLYLFMGSSLGNFSDPECVELLRMVAGHMTGAADRFLIGVDLPPSHLKPASKIRAAYNDARGVTAAFTLNGLRHINRKARLDFDWRGGWRHVAEYVEAERAIVTHVESTKDQDVTCADGSSSKDGSGFRRRFRAGERIFMEQSRKFDLPAIAALADACGLSVTRHWASANGDHLIVETAKSN